MEKSRVMRKGLCNMLCGSLFIEDILYNYFYDTGVKRSETT